MNQRLTKLQKASGTPSMIKDLISIESCKTSDIIELRYGFDSDHLAKAVDYFNLATAKEVKSLKQSLVTPI